MTASCRRAPPTRIPFRHDVTKRPTPSMTSHNAPPPRTGLDAIQVDLLPLPHGFFTRRGGISTGPFASLNCSLSSQDDRDSVLENRGRVADSFGLPHELLLGCTQ